MKVKNFFLTLLFSKGFLKKAALMCKVPRRAWRKKTEKEAGGKGGFFALFLKRIKGISPPSPIAPLRSEKSAEGTLLRVKS
jgi:hypothetical protein